MNQKNWKTRLRTCLCSVLAMTCVLSSIPVSAASSGDAMTEYVNIAEGRSYQSSVAPASDYGDNGGELTDGDYGSATLWDGRWVGYSGHDKVEITIDLGSQQAFQGVEAVFLNDVAGGGINYPGPFTFSYSEDGENFTEFHQGSIPSDAPENSVYTYSYQDSLSLDAQYVRLSFPANSWVFVGEIRVLQGKEIVLPEYNIAEGAGYTSDPAPHASFPDSGGELTDGFSPPADSYDGGWVGYSGIDGDVNITVDLGAVQEFRGVEALFLRDVPGGGIGYPNTVSFSYSDDGSRFTEYASGQKPSETPDRGLFNFTHVSSNAVEAQYVRLTFPGKYWVLVGEIRVLSDNPKTTGPKKPVITEDLSETMSAVEGNAVTLSVDASVSDNGILSYQWYKDGEKVGEDSNSFVIASAAMSDSGDYYVEVTNTLDGETAVSKSKTCHLTVAKQGAVAEKPVFSSDLEATKLVQAKASVTLSVKASVSDGGTLSYQWYKDNTAIGTNSDTFTIASAAVSDSGSYKVVVKNSKDGAESTTESTVCALTVEAVENKNVLAGLKYATSWVDDDSPDGNYIHSGYPDKSRTKLTDGQKNDNWGAGSNVGFHVTEAPVDITFDFGEERSFQEIQLGAFHDAGPSVLAPYQMNIQANIDGEWVTIFEGETVSSGARQNFVFATLDDKTITASGLRFYLSGRGAWMFLDEIEAFAKTSGEKPVGYLEEGAEPVNNNLALGVSYETSSPANDSYPDPNRTKLTDGKTASASFYNAAWSAYVNVGRVSMTFDLGAEKTFEEVRLNTLQHIGAGIRLPISVLVYTSNDKENWKLVSTDAIGTSTTENFVYNYKTTLYKPETARYVKVAVDPNGWFFVDEVEVLAKSMDNPDGAANNIASRKPYTSNPAADEAHPDSSALTKLTDGRNGPLDATNSAWVGYKKAGTNTEITIDLGANAAFQQVDVRFLNDKNNDIYLPANVTVSCSANGSSWQTVGTGDIAAIDSEAPLTYNFKYAFDQAAARYVKVSFPAEEKVLLDEIQILKNRTVFPEQEEDPIYVDANNLALKQSYTTSWAASSEYADSGKELTDGVRGSYLYTDVQWSGYEARDGEKFSVTVDLGENKSFEQVQVGMLKSSSRLLSIKYPTNIKVEYSADNAGWKTLANEKVVSDKEGVKRLNLVSSAVTGRYIRITFDQDGLLMLDEIAVYKKEVPGGDYENNPDAGPSYNLVRGKQYSASRFADYRSTPGLLTDGKYGQTGTKFDNNWTGFLRHDDNDAYNHLEFIFDMGSSNSISEIALSTRNDPANNLALPQNLCFWASQNGKDWAKIADVAAPDLTGSLQKLEMTWNAEKDGFKSSVAGSEMAYTRYIKVSFDVPSQSGVYAYLDEIKVIGKQGKCSTAGEVMDEAGYYNVALNKPYIMNPVQKSEEPDIDGKQLTDGIDGTADARDPAWVSFMQNYRLVENNATTKKSLESIIIDLQGTKSVTSVRTHLLAQEFSYMPWAVFTYASMDGKTWVPLSRTSNVDIWIGGRRQFGWRCKAEQGTAVDLVDDSIKSVAANYIRLDVEMLHTNMMDEIEVFGYDGVIEGAVPADNGRDLDNGRDYQKPGEDTAFIKDMVLCYNGWYGFDDESGMHNGDWNAEKYRPYLTYLDTDGKAQDTMFDAVCLLALTSRYGRAYNADVAESPEPPQFEDWEWYLDKTFNEGGDVDELNKAAEIAAKELGDPNYKVKLVVMSPGIDRRNHKFGPINGKYYDMDMPDYYNPDVKAEWQDCCDWWYDQVLTRFAAGNYEYIDFEGFYWLSEQVGFTPAQVLYNNRKVHELGYKMFWIPFNYANGYLWGRDVGFDAIAYQPNHFFGEPLEQGGISEMGNGYIDNVAYHANYGQIGLELEFDGRAFENPFRYNQFLDYLNGAVKNGMDGDGAYRNWYQAVSAMGVAAASEKAEVRALYDYSYQLMQGTYTEKPHIKDFSGATIDNDVGKGDSNGGSGSGSIGGGSSGGGSSKPDPDDKPTTDYTWEETENGYKLKDADGEYVTGWAKVDGKWYYLNADGIRQTGWQKVDSKWYYLKDDGTMATGWLKLGNVWYYLNAGGVMKTGWLQDGGKWYYLKDWGGMANTSWVQVGNTWYYFRGNGQMATGWLQQGNTWYYLKANGAMATGWNWVGNKCYYFAASGKMAANTTVGGYKLDASGAWVK